MGEPWSSGMKRGGAGGRCEQAGSASDGLAGGNNAIDGRQLQRGFDVEAAAPCVAQLVKTNLEVRTAEKFPVKAADSNNAWMQMT